MCGKVTNFEDVSNNGMAERLDLLPFGLACAFGFAVIQPNQQVARLTFQHTANFVQYSEFDAV